MTFLVKHFCLKTAASISLVAFSVMTLSPEWFHCAKAQEAVAQEIKISSDVVSKFKELNTEEQAKYAQQLYYDAGIKVDLTGNAVVTQFVPVSEGTYLLNTVQLNEKQQEVFKQLNGYEEQQKFIQQLTQDFSVKGVEIKGDLGAEVTQIIPDVKGGDVKVDLGGEVTQIIPNQITPIVSGGDAGIVKNPVIEQDISQVIVNTNPVVINNAETQVQPSVIVNTNPVVSNNAETQAQPSVIVNTNPVVINDAETQTQPSVIVNTNPVVINNAETQAQPSVIVNTNPVVSNSPVIPNTGGGSGGTLNSTAASNSTIPSSTIVNFSVQGGLNATANSNTGNSSIPYGTQQSNAHSSETRENNLVATNSTSTGLVTDTSVLKLGRLLGVEGVSGATITVGDFINSAVNTNGIVNMTAMSRMQPITNVLMTQDATPEKSVPQANLKNPSLLNSPEPVSGQGLTATSSSTVSDTQLIEIQEQLK